jgi:S-adenosylmethionine/arginine decarboxylase-like enzyme
MPQGRHVKVLGRGASSLLGSAKAVETMLREMVDLLGMRLLGAPHLYEVEPEIAKLGVEPFEDEGGVTGVCVLSTSHCSIHTWPLRPFFVMDVYSCRDFDAAVVEQHLAKSLGAYDVQITDISFALEYEFAQPRRSSRVASKPTGRSGRDGLRGWATKRAG